MTKNSFSNNLNPALNWRFSSRNRLCSVDLPPLLNNEIALQKRGHIQTGWGGGGEEIKMEQLLNKKKRAIQDYCQIYFMHFGY